MDKRLFTIPAIAATGAAAIAAPALAAPAANASADWFETCSVVIVESDKDISNVVYRLDGEDIKIEFEDGTNHLVLPGRTSDVWVKSGNNRSGDGPGYGERFSRPDACDATSTGGTSET